MIVLRQVYKYYNEQMILRDVSCVFESGKIYGICGEKGSGKTLLLQLMMGFSIVNNGTVSIDGKILHQDIPYPTNVGYVIGDMELLPYYDSYENLKQLARINHKATDEDIERTLVRVGLASSEKVASYTQDMKQRLNLAQAIYEKQDIILLDEPVSSMTEDGKKRFRQIVQEEKERGALVIITAEDSEELKEVCDQIYEIKEKRLQEIEI